MLPPFSPWPGAANPPSTTCLPEPPGQASAQPLWHQPRAEAQAGNASCSPHTEAIVCVTHPGCLWHRSQRLSALGSCVGEHSAPTAPARRGSPAPEPAAPLADPAWYRGSHSSQFQLLLRNRQKAPGLGPLWHHLPMERVSLHPTSRGLAHILRQKCNKIEVSEVPLATLITSSMFQPALKHC